MAVIRSLIIFFSWFLSFYASGCNEVALKNCFKHKGGATCYRKHNCSQSLFQRDFCQNFDFQSCLKWKGGNSCLTKQQACKRTLSSTRNNLEGYIPLVSKIPVTGEPQIKCDASDIIPINNIKTTDNFVERFIESAHNFGLGVKTYKLGNYQSHKTDCSGFLMQAMKKMGLKVLGPQFDLAPNYPNYFKKCDPNNLKPGDLLLLNRPGKDPTHWIMVSSQGKWPSENVEIMDVSSHKTYFRGKLKERRYLQSREVYSCVRHKDIDRL